MAAWKAWESTGTAGLDLARARQDAALPEVEAVLQQDMADLEVVGFDRTPAFFVNGTKPAEFDLQPLYDAILAEIERTSVS